MLERIEKIRVAATEAIAAASSSAELEGLRVRFLGRKAELTQILRGIAELPTAERGPVGGAGPRGPRRHGRHDVGLGCPAAILDVRRELVVEELERLVLDVAWKAHQPRLESVVI